MNREFPLPETDTVVTCHSNADHDAVAALIGAAALYPGAALIFPGTQERLLQNFYDDALQHLYAFCSLKDIDTRKVRRLVVVDTRQPARLNHVRPLLDRPDVEIHAWDHHPDSPDMVRAAFSMTADVASTSTLMAEEIKRRGMKLRCEDATILGLGIYGDTGSFTFASSTPRDFEAAAWLLRQGMDVNVIVGLVRHDMSRDQLRALNELLESAEVREFRGFSLAVASARLEGYLNDFAMLAPRFMEMQPCQALFALGAMDDKIQVVARSQVEQMDVGAICAKLGGGGHRYAAAAAVRGMTLPELRDFILTQASLQARPGRTAEGLMSSPVVGVPENAGLREAESVMSRYGLKAVPVFRPGTRVCAGWLEQQIAARAVSHGLGEASASDYMQRNFQVVTRGADLQSLMDIIVGARQRLVPVVDGPDPAVSGGTASTDEDLKARPVIGVVTRTDLIRLFLDDDAARLPRPRRKAQRERSLARALRIKMPAPCVDLLERAGRLGSRRGVNVYVVGGFVRDLLMDRTGKGWPDMDIDLVVEGDAIGFAHALAGELGGRVREHREFMTALVLFPASALGGAEEAGGEAELRVDVATARLEYYAAPAALPTVELSSIKMDLYRRDFTINAMAMQLNAESFGLLADFFDGQADIRRKRIRMLHALSFVEDPTRALRAVRFEQRYDFRIGPQCDRLIRNALDLGLMDRLSGSRILSEMELMLEERRPLACFVRMQEFDMLAAIHPQLDLTPGKTELLDRALRALDWHRRLYLPERADALLLLLLTLCRGATSSDTLAVAARFDLPENRRTALMATRSAVMDALPAAERWQAAGDPPSVLHGVLGRVPLEGLLYLMARVEDEDLHKALSLYVYQGRREKADIDGKDLRDMGLKPGPAFGRVLRAVLAAKLDGQASTRDAQLALAEDLARSFRAECPGEEDPADQNAPCADPDGERRKNRIPGMA